jgi:hypothetical protein
MPACKAVVTSGISGITLVTSVRSNVCSLTPAALWVLVVLGDIGRPEYGSVRSRRQ